MVSQVRTRMRAESRSVLRARPATSPAAGIMTPCLNAPFAEARMSSTNQTASERTSIGILPSSSCNGRSPTWFIGAAERRARGATRSREIAMRDRKFSRVAAAVLAMAVAVAGGCESTPPPAIAPDGSAGAAPPAGAVEVMYVANEGVLISAGDERVLIDGLHREYSASYPFLPAIEAAQAPFDGVDVVLVSHRHLDHFHAASVGRHLVNAPDAVLVSSAQVVGEVEAQFADFASIRSRVTAV